MDGKNWMELISEQNQVNEIQKRNQKTEQYGLLLTEEEIHELVAERKEVLSRERRVEFAGGILPQIIDTFCGSPYLDQESYAKTLGRLQEIFYLYKNEMMDEITDEELLNFMMEQFDGVCYGDLDYLEGTCLDIFAQAIRAGYSGYHSSDGRGEFGKFDIAARWDRELYLEALSNLF